MALGVAHPASARTASPRTLRSSRSLESTSAASRPSDALAAVLLWPIAAIASRLASTGADGSSATARSSANDFSLPKMAAIVWAIAASGPAGIWSLICWIRPLVAATSDSGKTTRRLPRRASAIPVSESTRRCIELGSMILFFSSSSVLAANNLHNASAAAGKRSASNASRLATSRRKVGIGVDAASCTALAGS